ncbi:hypothetical protein BVRB_3g052820 [Beta vulgaris subsp. vulgaris]|nr:hypothetical protein BVRB_3g052820 [Beta vulgaris subsp. vulgaris]
MKIELSLLNILMRMLSCRTVVAPSIDFLKSDYQLVLSSCCFEVIRTDNYGL